MDTQISLGIVIRFKLKNKGERTKAEKDIDDFLKTQAEGSFADNVFREISKKKKEFLFDTDMTIVVADMSAVVSARTEILSALASMPEVLNYEFNMVEINASPTV